MCLYIPAFPFGTKNLTTNHGEVTDTSIIPARLSFHFFPNTCDLILHSTPGVLCTTLQFRSSTSMPCNEMRWDIGMPHSFWHPPAARKKRLFVALLFTTPSAAPAWSIRKLRQVSPSRCFLFTERTPGASPTVKNYVNQGAKTWEHPWKLIECAIKKTLMKHVIISRRLIKLSLLSIGNHIPQTNPKGFFFYSPVKVDILWALLLALTGGCNALHDSFNCSLKKK